MLSLTAVNATPHVAVLSYLSDGEEPRAYATLAPGARLTQETFEGHRWRLQCTEALDVSAEICMPASAAEIRVDAPGAPVAPEDFYHHSVDAGVAGIRVRAAEIVATEAVGVAAEIIRAMLRHSPPAICERLRAAGCTISVIGREQKTSDIPEHRAWAELTKGEVRAARANPSG